MSSEMFRLELTVVEQSLWLEQSFWEMVVNIVKNELTLEPITWTTVIIEGWLWKWYVHLQSTPSSNWHIVHDLWLYPNITVFDDSWDEVIWWADPYTSLNVVDLVFNAPFSGKAYLS